MAEFKLDRIRFTWKGDWETATFYTKDDIVRFGGKSYVCLDGHTSSIFYNDLGYINTLVEPDTAEPKWVLWFDGYEWKNDWTVNTNYNVGDIVQYGSVLYICNTRHLSAATLVLGIEADLGTLVPLVASKWTMYAKTDNWLGTWTAATRYKLNDFVKYNGTLYRCNINHTSDSALEDDQPKWDIAVATDKWVNNWSISTQYKATDIVRYGGIVYRCIEGHTSAVLESDGLLFSQSKWEIVFSGIDYKSNWTATTIYKLNDIVKYGANLWICTLFHTASATFDVANWAIYIPGLEYLSIWVTTTSYVPGDIVRYGGYSYTSKTHNTNSVPSTQTSDWTLLTTGFKIQGDWNSTTIYLVGDVVRRNGNVYVAIQDNQNQETTLSAFWTIVIPGIEWRNLWMLGSTYVINDVVTYFTSSYKCILKHTATNLNNPLISTNEWVLFVSGDPNEPMNAVGDTTYQDVKKVKLSIGASGNTLKSTGIVPYWGSFGEIGYTYYVSPTGVDSLTTGVTLNAPFKTIKYACDFVRAGTQNQSASFLLRSNKDWIVAEMYQWMLYQKSNNIAPFTSGSVFDQTKTFRDAEIVVDSLIYDLSRGGNSQIVTTTYTYFIPGTNTFFNTTVASEMPFFIAALTKVLSLSLLAISNTAPAQSYQTLNNVSLTTNQVIDITYTAESNTDIVITNLLNILLTALTNASVSAVPQITAGLEATIFIKTGTYSETLPIVVPKDTALVGDELRSTVVQPATGNETLNMFYVRNGSGIRNMTLKGLSGTLGTLNSYLTRRPSAGAFVSLDPGTGPSDSSVWITTRSPYIQNVTTFGTGCVGLKVDGSLHESGNKSVVANDFTQILSDGIGAWCTGSGAITELVSVFSYYAHIGYLSELGGKIRATNGNSSYGTYGTVAEGYDVTETPLSGSINTQNQQAQVSSVFAGQSQNKILKLEYLNAGQNYSSAIFAFAGAGTNAVAIADEFRDLAIFENRILGSDYSAGGTGYITAGNQAQAGNITTITIASNDTRLASNYLGMRIIITSGTGVGQYGYIQAYDIVSKLVTVYKESTGTAGWDHLIPGTASAAVLDSTTVYSIEPRVTFSKPTVAKSTVAFGTNTTFYKPAYGNGVFLIPYASGIKYSTTSGTSWNVATNAVTPSNIVYGSGKFVAINSYVSSGGYSIDGISWTSTTIPSAAWSSLAAGNPNLLSYTEDFSNGVWVRYGTASVTANATTAPDGSLTADTITIPASSGIYQTQISVVTGNITISIWLKGSENGSTIQLLSNTNLSDPLYATATLTTDWQRFSFTRSLSVGTTLASLQLNTLSAGTVSAWGAQLESGSIATQYQPVYTTAVKQFVAVATGSTTAMHSTNGITWTSTTNLPSASTWTSVTYGNGKYVTVSTNSSNAAYSLDGITWTASTLPVVRYWSAVAYGNGRFVAVSAFTDNIGAYSFDGITWVQMTMPQTGWGDISYGNGTFVAAHYMNAVAYSNDGINWTYDPYIGFINTSNITYGNPSNVPIWIATPSGLASSIAIIKTGTRALGRATVGSGKLGAIKIWDPGSGYDTTGSIVQFVGSITGTTLSVTRVTSGAVFPNMYLSGGNGNIVAGTTITSVNNVAFNGFISNTTLTVTSTPTGTISVGLVLSGPGIASGTTIVSSDTAVFTGSITSTTLTVSAMTSGIITAGMRISGGSIPYGTYIVSNINGAGTNSTWTISAPMSQSSTSITGSRFIVDTSQSVELTAIAGLSYQVSQSQTITPNNLQGTTTAGTPVVSITDPNATIAAIVTCRVGNGVLSNPSFSNRGDNYQTSTTTCTVTGNGYADIYPVSKYITVSNLSLAPSPGASIQIAGNNTQFKIVNITNLSGGTYYLQIGPPLTRSNTITHNTAVQIRQKYSQVRLTGHDYLLIGTGNKTESNYPNVDTTTALQSSQVQESNQGRVFVTSTDQDGNFKVGGLFGVQQATGTVTVSADLFNLSGLNQLTLGGVQVGQNTVTITQFSTDIYFTANSDNIVPTQKAIKSYVARMISNGGANAMTSVLVAGTVGVGPQRIFSTTNTAVKMNNKVSMRKGADGHMLAMQFFAHSFGTNGS